MFALSHRVEHKPRLFLRHFALKLLRRLCPFLAGIFLITFTRLAGLLFLLIRLRLLLLFLVGLLLLLAVFRRLLIALLLVLLIVFLVFFVFVLLLVFL